MTTRLPTHLCPSCNNPLVAEADGAGRYVAWCSVGRCASEIGDKGALGDTPEQAAANLIETMNKEHDWIFE